MEMSKKKVSSFAITEKENNLNSVLDFCMIKKKDTIKIRTW